MTCITKLPSGDLDERPATKRFRRSAAARAVPEVVARQAQITLLAFQAHDQREHALAFLNEPDAELGGRPIDIAGAGDDGLAAATARLAARRPA